MRYHFKLYSAGQSEKSGRALENLRKLAKEHLGDDVEIEVVNILENPEKAFEERILAVPMVVRESPEPKYRILGDLSDQGRVLHALGINNNQT